MYEFVYDMFLVFASNPILYEDMFYDKSAILIYLSSWFVGKL